MPLLHTILNDHIADDRSYSFHLDGVLHWMDSAFLIQELIDSPAEDQEELLLFLEPVKDDPELLHSYLCRLAILYVQANS
ncbi:hypothetical protein [Alkalicoccus urumqiensis]|uniref:Uncharacterized protein n=1 Tax=Alkalicoccus urumqiensis TaxID=1548213 RepID=A0A2P6MJ68_ALKUR|nr:hypothetical protein [Alkalicoccus urumqiensis]PRO66329.1 hypothetical protein C6I21_05870 [Alkalicoccus urumqiensis]